MIYNVNVYRGQQLFEAFTVEGIDAATALELQYEKLGFRVYVQPDTMAYIRKYGINRGPTPTTCPAP